MDPKGVISDARLGNGFDRYHLDMPSQTSSTYHRRSIPACDPSQSWSIDYQRCNQHDRAFVDDNQFLQARKCPAHDIFYQFLTAGGVGLAVDVNSRLPG
jgi:hypothetical protein